MGAMIGAAITLFIWLGLCKNTVSKEELSQKFNPEILITVSNALISNTGAGYYAPRTSAVFNLANAIEGYRIQSSRGNEVIMTVFCTKAELDKYIELVRYESLKKDSIIITIPAQNQPNK